MRQLIQTGSVQGSDDQTKLRLLNINFGRIQTSCENWPGFATVVYERQKLKEQKLVGKIEGLFKGRPRRSKGEKRSNPSAGLGSWEEPAGPGKLPRINYYKGGINEIGRR